VQVLGKLLDVNEPQEEESPPPPVSANEKFFTLAEVGKHDTEHDAWINFIKEELIQ